MNRKILALLVICIATISVASVYAGEQLVSHDFGEFTMNIPESQENISQKQGGVNQTIYAIPNQDGTTFAFLEYFNTSNTNGNNNTTEFVLSKIKENYTVKTEGGIISWETGTAGEHGYLISSSDNTKVVIITSSDSRIQEAIKSINFK